MLTQKQKTVPYIGVFKISTGEEIIATVVQDDADSLLIKNPLCMVATQTGYQFAPLMLMAAHGGIQPLNRNSVITSAEAEPTLEGQYESVTTGIALPQKSKIII